jgi:hypothetical protein
MFVRLSLSLKLHSHLHPRPSTSPSERIQRYPLSSLKCHISVYGCLVSSASRPCSISSFSATPFTFTVVSMFVCSIFVCSSSHSCFSSHRWCNYKVKNKNDYILYEYYLFILCILCCGLFILNSK